MYVYTNRGFLGSINDAVGGVTSTLLKGNVSTIFKDFNDQHRNARRNNTDTKGASVSGGGGGLPYQRYQQTELAYQPSAHLTNEHRPLPLPQETAFNNHACPDSPGAVNHARVWVCECVREGVCVGGGGPHAHYSAYVVFAY